MEFFDKNFVDVTSSGKAGQRVIRIGERFFAANPAASIDLSFITAKEGDIRSGKIGADKDGKPVTGTLVPSSGGSGTFDLFKVTEYVRHRPEITATGTVVISGIGTVADVDRSAANGTYNLVTERDDLTSSDSNHTFKHESAEYYYWFEWENIDKNNPEESYGYWYIGTKPRSDYFLSCYEDYPDTLRNGTREWENWDWGDMVEVTQTVTKETFPEIPLVLKGVKATRYSTNERRWTFDTEVFDFVRFESTPILGCVYASTTSDGIEGLALLGEPVDSESPYVTDSNTVILLTGGGGDRADYRHDMTEVGVSGIAGVYGIGYNFNGGYIQVHPEGDEFLFGACNWTWEAYIYPVNYRRQVLFAYEEDINFGVCFSYEGERRIGVFGTASGGWSNYMMSDPLELNKWYHFALVRNGNTLYSFIDDVPTGYTADMNDVSVGEAGQAFGIGRWGDDPSDFSARWQGYMDEIRISNIARYQA